MTAAEIVYSSADHTSDHMGLKTWKNDPDGAIRRSDVTVAKNYLTEVQIRQLDRTVSGFFDYIEDLTERGIAFTMEDFSRSVNEFLEFRRYDVLEGKGGVSRDVAVAKAVSEYNEYRKSQDYMSDFDKEVRRLTDRKDKRGYPACVKISRHVQMLLTDARLHGLQGLIDQLVRSPALQAGGREFESRSVHLSRFLCIRP